MDIASSPTTARRRARPITRIDRLALRRLAWGVAAVVLAIVAQGTLERGTFAPDAAALLLAAGAIFAAAARGVLAPAVDAAPVALPHPREPAAFIPGAAVLGLGLIANLAGLWLFGTSKEPTNLSWLLYIGSLPIALAGVYLLDARPSARNLLRRNLPALAVLAAIVAVALSLRVYRLATLPAGLWADEAMSGLDIVRIIADPAYRPLVGIGPAQGLPALAWYLTVPFFAALGPTELALRLPAALAGTAGVVAVYLLGRALFGNLYGLVAAGFLATMSWHITFSRIAMHGVYSTALNAFSLACLIFALRTGRRSLFALAGLSLGLSINFYFAARLFAAVAAVYLLHQFVIGRLPWLRRNIAGLALFGVTALMAGGPLLLLAYQQPRVFNERAEVVSIQREIERSNSYEPLFENIRRHAQMFNIRGDSNGRHNLPGQTMLERTTAALAVIGFVLALTRAFRPELLVPLAWLGIMMLGGILTLSFEAPQGYRTVDNTVAGALLAALPVAALAERLGRLVGGVRLQIGRLRPRASQLAAAAVAVLILVPVGFANVDRYFVRQAGDSAVWASHAIPETLIGREIAAGRTMGTIYVDQTMMDHPSTRFLAPGSFPHQRFDPGSTLPLRDPAGGTIFLGAESTTGISTVRRYYPDARVVEHRNPAGGPIVLYQLVVPPEAVARVQGAEALYWITAASTGEPAARARVSSPGEHGPSVPPAASVVEWRAVLAAPQYGRYAFRLEGPPEATLRIDESDLAVGGQEVGATLARGNHGLAIRAPVTAGAPPVRLLWRTPQEATFSPVPSNVLYTAPVTSNGLLGSYYRGTTWSGEPGLQQIDPSLQLRFHLLPLPRPYSVEWRGKLYIPSDGSYRFGASAIDESWIYVDERLIVDNSRNVGGYGEGGAVLRAGFHDIRIRYLDRTGHTFINVFWTPPGRGREAIPTEYLFPPQGSYPDKVVPPPPPPREAAPAAPAAEARPGVPAKTAAPAAPPSSGRPGPTTNAPALTSEALLRVGVPGAAAGQLNQPRAAVVDKQGNIYVADTANHRVQKFSPTGEHVASWGDEQTLQEPLGIAVDSSGRIVVLDSLPGWIRRYTPTGEFVDQFGGPGARFYHPRGLSIDAADNIYVADTGGGRIVKFNAAGEVVDQIGQRGTGPGMLGEPTGAAADPFGNVWVADSQLAKLVRFGPSGTADIEIALPKSGSMHGPHVAVDDKGTVYVTDPEGGRIYAVGTDGTTRGQIGADELRRPVGISVAADGRIVVGDVNLQIVVVFSQPGGG